MKGRYKSSKEETKLGMEIDKLHNLKQEPHLSGAYIRSLVKQLTSSRTTNSMASAKDRSFVSEDGCSGLDMPNQQTRQPQQHKKQVRRRLHTSKPYQEKLLNMAEARREIVAALKFHRASMKAQQQPIVPVSDSNSSCFEQAGKIESRKNPGIYTSDPANFSNCLDTLSCASFSPHAPPPTFPYFWSSPQIHPDNLNFPLPNQTLGLNLNFQDFNNLDTTFYHSNSSNNNPSSSSVSFPSSFSSPSPPTSNSIATEEAAKPIEQDLADNYGSGLHQVMDDDEMAEIRSIGERHQMEWNDTVNLMTSAWWFKFLKTMESDNVITAESDSLGYPFDQVVDFPPWLNAKEQEQFDHCSPQDYYHDPTLPCMEIGEIEGMDGEWLA